MLIRSQDKKVIVNIDNAFNIEIRDINGATAIYIGSSSSCCNMAEYSTRAKAMKVLDMIQEAYANVELIPMAVQNIGKMFQKAIGKAIMNKMIFQMPEEGSVEV